MLQKAAYRFFYIGLFPLAQFEQCDYAPLASWSIAPLEEIGHECYASERQIITEYRMHAL